jgi:hypothetical protein
VRREREEEAGFPNLPSSDESVQEVAAEVPDQLPSCHPQPVGGCFQDNRLPHGYEEIDLHNFRSQGSRIRFVPG